jgi:hypothetical protein
MPDIRPREEVPAEELGDYDIALEWIRKYSEENDVARARPVIDGKPYAYGYRVGWTHAPRLNSWLREATYGVMEYQGKRGWYSAADHEWIDLVLGFDSGYWGLHGGHTANAITSGIRVEAMEALRDDRLDDLTDDERQVVEFIRAVCNCAMTDEIWLGMVDRLGTRQGAIGLGFLTCMLWTAHRMMNAFGVPAIGLEQWNELLESYRSGAEDPAKATQDYVWSTLGARAAETP